MCLPKITLRLAIFARLVGGKCMGMASTCIWPLWVSERVLDYGGDDTRDLTMLVSLAWAFGELMKEMFAYCGAGGRLLC